GRLSGAGPVRRFRPGMGRKPENPFSQKHCKCRRGSALGAHVLPAHSHPPSVRNVLGTPINKSSQSRELSPRPWVSSAIRHRVFLTLQVSPAWSDEASIVQVRTGPGAQVPPSVWQSLPFGGSITYAGTGLSGLRLTDDARREERNRSAHGYWRCLGAR